MSIDIMIDLVVVTLVSLQLRKGQPTPADQDSERPAVCQACGMRDGPRGREPRRFRLLRRLRTRPILVQRRCDCGCRLSRGDPR